MKTYVVILLTASGLLMVACNQGVQSASNKFNELPPAVQKTARAQAPNAEIADVSRTSRNGMDVYEVQFRENGRNPKVVIAPDGKLVSSDLPNPPGAIQRALTPTGAAGTAFSALPLAVQKTIQTRAPNAPIASISRHDSNGRVVYEVEFSDAGRNPTIRVADDGTLVQDLQK
jgi:uncharacterized membrane protein YkoI